MHKSINHASSIDVSSFPFLAMAIFHPVFNKMTSQDSHYKDRQ